MIPDASPEDRSQLAVVPFGFWTDHEERDGKLVPVDYAKWGKRGYANWESSDKVARLMKSAKDNRGRQDATLTVWDALEPHYKRWKEGQEAVTDGYALEGWAGGITKGQITACKALHIHSVEDLAGCPDDVVLKGRLEQLQKEQAEDRKAMQEFMAAHAIPKAEMPGDVAQNEPEKTKRKVA
jgi:hypothetical protein